MPFFLRSISLWVAIILAVPTSLILVTWNALPGQRLYAVKRGLEEVPRIAFGKTKVAADYEVAISDRRFSEAVTLVKTDNTLGLTELNTSIKATETKVLETQNTQAKEKFISNLENYNTKLETQKQTLIAAAPPPVVPPPTTVTNVTNVTNVTTVTTVTNITVTQQIIAQTIQELKKEEKEKKEKSSTTGTGVLPDGKSPESSGKIDTSKSNSEGEDNRLPGKKPQ